MPSIFDETGMIAGVVCLEVLVTTIIAWIGIWGLVDEALENIDSKKIRCCVYAFLLGAALLAAGLQNQVTVCGLL
jgi:hypothetical protein